MAKTIPETGVVVLTGKAPAFGPQNIVPVVNRLVGQSDQLGIQEDEPGNSLLEALRELWVRRIVQRYEFSFLSK